MVQDPEEQYLQLSSQTITLGQTVTLTGTYSSATQITVLADSDYIIGNMNGSSFTFEYTPTTTGVHEITAKYYGSHPKTGGNTQLYQKTVSLTVNPVHIVQSASIINGTASIQLDTTDLPINSYDISARFAENNTYKASTGNGTLTVEDGTISNELQSVSLDYYEATDDAIALDLIVGNTDLNAYGIYDGDYPETSAEEFLNNNYRMFILITNDIDTWASVISIGVYNEFGDINDEGIYGGREIRIVDYLGNLEEASTYDLIGTFPQLFAYEFNEGTMSINWIYGAGNGDVINDMELYLHISDGVETYEVCTSGLESFIEQMSL